MAEKVDRLKPYPLDSRVKHKSWGEGMVIRYEANKVVILFDEAGYKTIEVGMALLGGLLRHLE